MEENYRLLLLSDTHVGDRTKALNPKLLDAVRAERPQMILHAGDVSRATAISALEEIAPVRAVQGNRDFLGRHTLPKTLQFEVRGLQVVLTHGHISIWHYLMNYARLFLTGMRATRRSYEYRLARLFPEADILVYGHTHLQSEDFHSGICFLNPGAGYPQFTSRYKIQYMLLDIAADGGYTVTRRTITP